MKFEPQNLRDCIATDCNNCTLKLSCNMGGQVVLVKKIKEIFLNISCDDPNLLLLEKLHMERKP